MSHLKRVTKTSDSRSHWVAAAPLGLEVEWDAETINEVENTLLAWRLMAAVIRLLPAPAPLGGDKARPGWQSVSAVPPSRLTALNDCASIENIEVPLHGSSAAHLAPR
jgi:hypothetical protein